MARYSIRELSLLTGIKPHTIRVWEQRYGVFSPERTKSNIRRYTDADLRLALNIVYLQNMGYRISRIAKLSSEEIAELVSKGSQYEFSSPIPEMLLMHTKNFDDVNFEKTIQDYVEVKGLQWTFENVFIPYQNLMGQLWQAGTMSLAHEHFSTCILRNTIISKTYELQKEASSSKRVLFFLPQGEFHDLALIYYNYIAKQAGVQTLYLGQNIPLKEMKKVLKAQEITHLFTAITVVQNKSNLDTFLQGLLSIIGNIPLLATGKCVEQNANHLPDQVLGIANASQFKKILGEG